MFKKHYKSLKEKTSNVFQFVPSILLKTILKNLKLTFEFAILLQNLVSYTIRQTVRTSGRIYLKLLKQQIHI